MKNPKFTIALAGVAFLAAPVLAQEAGVVPLPAPVPAPADAEQVRLEGTVTSVDALDGVFVMDTGSQEVRVEVAGMDDYPLDADGTPQVTVGDRVQVVARASPGGTGAMLQVMAVSLVVLAEEEAKAPAE